MNTIMLVLRTSSKFNFKDMELITTHIHKQMNNARIICLFDLITEECDLGYVKLLPMKYKLSGWWSKLNIFDPELEQYRPFLYMDLDTAIIGDITCLFPQNGMMDKFIALEDFYQKNKLASGLLWIPKGSDKVSRIWKGSIKKGMVNSSRLDKLLRELVRPDLFFQDFTDLIKTFKPKFQNRLTELPMDTSVVCFHGNPRMNEITSVSWLNKYRKEL